MPNSKSIVNSQLSNSQFPQCLPHGFFYHRVWLQLLVYVVEGYLHMNTFVRQYMFVQAVCLAHQSSEMIALNGMLKQRLGCPNQHLCLVVTGQIGYTQWPRYKSFTMTIQVVYCYLTTQFLGFWKSIIQRLMLVAIPNTS